MKIWGEAVSAAPDPLPEQWLPGRFIHFGAETSQSLGKILPRNCLVVLKARRAGCRLCIRQVLCRKGKPAARPGRKARGLPREAAQLPKEGKRS